jgi:hypothetical protein
LRVVEHPCGTVEPEDVRDGQNESGRIRNVSKDDGVIRGIAQLDEPVDGRTTLGRKGSRSEEPVGVRRKAVGAFPTANRP